MRQGDSTSWLQPQQQRKPMRKSAGALQVWRRRVPCVGRTKKLRRTQLLQQIISSRCINSSSPPTYNLHNFCPPLLPRLNTTKITSPSSAESSPQRRLCFLRIPHPFYGHVLHLGCRRLVRVVGGQKLWRPHPRHVQSRSFAEKRCSAEETRSRALPVASAAIRL